MHSCTTSGHTIKTYFRKKTKIDFIRFMFIFTIFWELFWSTRWVFIICPIKRQDMDVSERVCAFPLEIHLVERLGESVVQLWTHGVAVGVQYKCSTCTTTKMKVVRVMMNSGVCAHATNMLWESFHTCKYLKRYNSLQLQYYVREIAEIRVDVTILPCRIHFLGGKGLSISGQVARSSDRRTRAARDFETQESANAESTDLFLHTQGKPPAIR